MQTTSAGFYALARPPCPGLVAGSASLTSSARFHSDSRTSCSPPPAPCLPFPWQASTPRPGRSLRERSGVGGRRTRPGRRTPAHTPKRCGRHATEKNKTKNDEGNAKGVADTCYHSNRVGVHATTGMVGVHATNSRVGVDVTNSMVGVHATNSRAGVHATK